MAIYIGTSGWSYDHWRGILYPHKASSKERLDHYVARYNTVEVNNTFYRWPSHDVFTAWREQVPAGFRMTIKASRALSHSKRLREPEEWTKRIAASATCLGENLGILLLQLPPNFALDLPRLRSFLQQVPSPLKLTLEFRHLSWHTEKTFSLLEEYGAAYCIMSGAQLPCILRVTTSFVYVRLHGPDEHHLYSGSYANDDLHWWAARIREWEQQGKDIWVYFNNDPYGHAVHNADTLKKIVEP